MTCKYQTLALVTSPNTVHLHADASGKCLSLPQYVQCQLQADGKAHPILALPAWYVGLCLLRPNERCQHAFFLGLCFCKANEALLLPDAGVELHSWANSQCLLYSMTCLKWHASPKEGGDQLSSRHSPTWSGSVNLDFDFPVQLCKNSNKISSWEFLDWHLQSRSGWSCGDFPDDLNDRRCILAGKLLGDFQYKPCQLRLISLLCCFLKQECEDCFIVNTQHLLL